MLKKKLYVLHVKIYGKIKVSTVKNTCDQKKTDNLINTLRRKTSSQLHMIARDFLLQVFVLKNPKNEIERR